MIFIGRRQIRDAIQAALKDGVDSILDVDTEMSPSRYLRLFVRPVASTTFGGSHGGRVAASVRHCGEEAGGGHPVQLHRQRIHELKNAPDLHQRLYGAALRRHGEHRGGQTAF